MNLILKSKYLFGGLMLLQLLFIPVAHADQVVVTSGRVVYDPFGRVVRVYHPTVDSERVDSFSRAVDNVAPTRTEYDELDRPLKVTLPDGTYTTYEYSLVGNALKTTVTDAEGNSSATLVNGSRGQQQRHAGQRQWQDRPEHPVQGPSRQRRPYHDLCL